MGISILTRRPLLLYGVESKWRVLANNHQNSAPNFNLRCHHHSQISKADTITPIMDTSRHRRDEHRSYRSRSPSRPHSHAMSTSHSPRSQHSRRRDHYRHTSDERDVRSHSAERRKRAHSRREHERRAVAAPATLPFDARPLSKHDLQVLEPMFALYLDIQKNIDIADLDEREVKGRWKSFVGKW